MRTLLRTLRLWLYRPQRGYVPVMADQPRRTLEPVRTSHVTAQVKGQWVAMRNGEIVEVGATFDEVMLRLHDREITDVTVIRIPADTEAELVGLG
jgi:hypothetical protein